MSLWSTGLRNLLLDSATGLRQIFGTTSGSSYGILNLYSGTIPATADAAVSTWGSANASGATAVAGTTLLASVTVGGASPNPSGAGYSGIANGSCLGFAAVAADVLSKISADTWKAGGTYVSSGTPTFWRLVMARANGGVAADTGASSTTECRVQGTFGTGNAELVTGSGVLTNGVDQPINYFAVSFPPGS
jgi:hypothetical protein